MADALRTIDQTANDASVSNITKGDILASPIKIELRNFKWFVYVYLSPGIHFVNDTGISSYGWVRLSSSNNSYYKPSNDSLWKSVVRISEVECKDNYIKFIPSGVLEENRSIQNRLQELETGTSPNKNKEIKKIVTEGYTNYVRLVASSPVAGEYQPPLPGGKYREVWLNSESESSDLKFKETKSNFEQFKKSLKQVSRLSQKHENAKKEIYKYGNIEQQDNDIVFKNSKGQIVNKHTPIITYSGVKSVEMPFCKPTNFSLSNKKFNELADKVPSSILQPITMWVNAIGDTEEYAMAFILAVWSMTNVFKK